MDIIPLQALKDNYIWTLMSPAKKIWVIDPGEAAPVEGLIAASGHTLKGILITHHHWDHTAGAQELKERYKVPVYGPANSPYTEITHPLQEGDELILDEYLPPLKIMVIPGHTLDHIAYHGGGHVFCGDTLFSAGCGRVFEGTPAQMYASLQKIAKLSPETKIYCAHEYTWANLKFASCVEPKNKDIQNRLAEVQALREKGAPTLPTTLQIELLTNPFLRCHDSEVRKQVQNQTHSHLDTPTQIFTALREWKNVFNPV